MELRRDAVLELPGATTRLARHPKTFPNAPYLDSNRPYQRGFIFKSTTPQRPAPCEAKPHVWHCRRSDGTRFEVSDRSRDVLPTTYGPQPTLPWVCQPDRLSSDFASGSPQRSLNDAVAFWPYERPLSAELDDLNPAYANEVRERVVAAPPGRRGVAWGRSPRGQTAGSRRDEASASEQSLGLEPFERSMVQQVIASPRAYKPAFLSARARFPEPRPMSTSTYEPPAFGQKQFSTRVISARTGTASPAFLAPRYSKAARLGQRRDKARRSPRARELAMKEAISTWAKLSDMPAYAGAWLPRDDAILDPHYTRRPATIYF